MPEVAGGGRGSSSEEVLLGTAVHVKKSSDFLRITFFFLWFF